jgi:hypothetical protein
LLETLDDDSHQLRPAKQLPETLTSLHARNVAFKEALRRARENALQAKRAADLLKASKEANQKAKNERLAGKRGLRSRLLEEEQAKRQNEIAKENRGNASRSGNRVEDSKRTGGVKTSSIGLLDWEEMEDDLEARGEVTTEETPKPSKPQVKRPLQNKATARTARPAWDDGLDERLVSDAEINGRWKTNLLSGGRSGSVSLAQKKQRDKNAVARMHKKTMALCEEADHMLEPALKEIRTFSGLVEDDLMESAFVRTERKDQARTERFLQVTDGEVTEQFLLEQDRAEWSLSLAELAFEEE